MQLKTGLTDVVHVLIMKTEASFGCFLVSSKEDGHYCLACRISSSDQTHCVVLGFLYIHFSDEVSFAQSIFPFFILACVT